MRPHLLDVGVNVSFAFFIGTATRALSVMPAAMAALRCACSASSCLSASSSLALAAFSCACSLSRTDMPRMMSLPLPPLLSGLTAPPPSSSFNISAASMARSFSSCLSRASRAWSRQHGSAPWRRHDRSIQNRSTTTMTPATAPPAALPTVLGASDGDVTEALARIKGAFVSTAGPPICAAKYVAE